MDPKTGRLMAGPENPNAGAGQEMKNNPMDPEWMREIPGSSAAGGMKLNVQGRLRHRLTVNVPFQGEPTVECTHKGSSLRSSHEH